MGAGKIGGAEGMGESTRSGLVFRLKLLYKHDTYTRILTVISKGLGSEPIVQLHDVRMVDLLPHLQALGDGRGVGVKAPQGVVLACLTVGRAVRSRDGVRRSILKRSQLRVHLHIFGQI